MPIYRAGGGAILPGGSAPGKVFGVDDDGNPAWLDPAGAKSLFRGDWSSDSLAWTYDFASGIDSDLFASSVTGGGAQTPRTDPSVPSGPYGASLALFTNPMGPSHHVEVALDVAATGVVSPTRLKFFYREYDAFSTFESWARLKVITNTGTELFEGQLNSWTEVEVSLPANVETLIFRHIGVIMDYNEMTGSYVAGIRLYENSAPYMLGEYVTHNGEMWKSLVNNNNQTPNPLSTTWESTLALPSPAGSTAERPEPDAAGLGFPFFDATLNKPIWSNGTAWVDATGTEV